MLSRRFVLLSACVVACSNPASRSSSAQKPPPDAHLEGPEESCGNCHPRHVAEWRGSAHAYSIHDPVFVAMLGYGQQQTKGALGDFCVQCHTPLGFRSGETNVHVDGEGDAATFAQPITGLSVDAMDGVTCTVCHSITKVNEDANAQFEMAMDGVRRGPISDPDPTPAHASLYSSLHEETHVCGTCHDVVNSKHVLLESTHIEWEQSSRRRRHVRIATCRSTRALRPSVPASEPCTSIASSASTCRCCRQTISLGTTRAGRTPRRSSRKARRSARGSTRALGD